MLGRRTSTDQRSGAAVGGRRRAVAAVVVMGVVAMLAVACGDAGDDAATPGFDARPKEVDESPFELAQPTTTEGPTTIPGDVIPGARGTGGRGSGNAGSNGGGSSTGSGEGTTTTVAPVTTTTTTTPLSEPVLYAPVQIQSLCGMSRALQSFGLILNTPGLNIGEYVTIVRQNLGRYAEVSPPNLRATVDSIGRTINQLIDLGASVGYRTSDPRFQRAIFDAANGTGDYAGFPAQVDVIYRHEKSQC